MTNLEAQHYVLYIIVSQRLSHHHIITGKAKIFAREEPLYLVPEV
jgi:hypothetical protein